MRDTRIALFVHLVWATWNREPLLVGEVERRVYRSLEATCAELDVEILALGGVADHVHLLVRLPATLPIAVLVKRLKGASSHLVTHQITPGDFFKWQGGYAAFSAGLKQLPALTEYVRQQKQHHAAGTTYPIYEPPPLAPASASESESASESASADFAAARHPGAISIAGWLARAAVCPP